MASHNKHYNDNENILYYLLGIPLILILVWFAVSDRVLANLFSASITPFHYFSYIPAWLVPDGAPTLYSNVSNQMRFAPPEHYSAETIFQILTMWGWAIRIVLLPALLFLGFIYFKAPPSSKYTRTFDLEKLAKEYNQMYPCTTPIIGKRLHKQNLFIGPWRIADDPFNFALAHNLFIHKKALPKKKIHLLRAMELKQRRKYFPHHRFVHIDTKQTDLVFVNQLGTPWRGLDSLDAAIKTFTIALMMMIANRDLRSKAKTVLNEISRNYSEKVDKNGKTRIHINLPDVGKYQAEVEVNPAVKSITKSHAFTSTVLIALLIEARRRTGKVPPADFLWLRPYNRTLWYSLHAIGGQTPWSEGAAAWCHYYSELKAQQPLTTPCIQGATDALIDVLIKDQWIHPDSSTTETL